MLTVERIKEIVSRICRKYGVKKAYLFGSYAKGLATEESDVDLLIERGELKTYREYFCFCDELESELGTDVDVASEETILPAFRDSILKNKVALYGV